MPKNSPRLSIIAAATLLAWLGAVYHDVWLELAEIAHHHHDHSGSHQDSHDGDDEDGDQSLILPNIHSTAFAVKGASSVGTWVSSPVGAVGSWASWIDILDLRGVDCSNAPPGWTLGSEKHAAVLLQLAHSVQSNAPPTSV